MGRATRGVRVRRAGRLVALALIPVALLLAGHRFAATSPIEAARERLRALIEDVTASTAYRYRTTDDHGRWMDTAKIIRIPEAGTFAAVYHTWSDDDRQFRVHLATSMDLMSWSWQATLANAAAQATIAAAPDRGYVVAWEQSPDPIHLVVAFYPGWDALRLGAAARRFEAPMTMAGCAEGTPSIERVTSRRVDIGFHFYSGCRHDRQARGSTDWSRWRAASRPSVDGALQAVGARGHIGDRDGIQLDGHHLELVEGQLELGDPGTWRTFLYDGQTGRADLLRFRSHAGSRSFANPTIGRVTIDGRVAILVTLYVFTEGAAGEESGQLVYYRTLD